MKVKSEKNSFIQEYAYIEDYLPPPSNLTPEKDDETRGVIVISFFEEDES